MAKIKTDVPELAKWDFVPFPLAHKNRPNTKITRLPVKTDNGTVFAWEGGDSTTVYCNLREVRDSHNYYIHLGIEAVKQALVRLGAITQDDMDKFYAAEIEAQRLDSVAHQVRDLLFISLLPGVSVDKNLVQSSWNEITEDLRKWVAEQLSKKSELKGCVWAEYSNHLSEERIEAGIDLTELLSSFDIVPREES